MPEQCSQKHIWRVFWAPDARPKLLNSDTSWPELGQFWPTPAEIGPTWTKHGPTGAELGQTWTMSVNVASGAQNSIQNAPRGVFEHICGLPALLPVGGQSGEHFSRTYSRRPRKHLCNTYFGNASFVGFLATKPKSSPGTSKTTRGDASGPGAGWYIPSVRAL